VKDLKSRLDRQPKAPPERKRSGFGRGVIVGFLLAGVSFALASVSLTGWPTSARQFFSAPVEYVVQTWRHHQEFGQDDAQHAQVKAQPLGPAWFPTHASAEPASGPAPEITGAIATPNRPGSKTASSNAPPVTGTGTPAAAGGAIARPPFGYRIAAQQDVYPFLKSTLHNVNVIELTEADAFGDLCGPLSISPQLSYLVISTRHIAADPTCKLQHSARIMELKLGYLAVALVRSKLYAPMYLTPRTLFLALARRVPDPAHAGQLIDNPYTTWNSTWNGSGAALPEDSIQFYGPAQDSPAGRLAIELLMDEGCNSFPTLVAMRDHKDPQFESACHELRTDGHYREIPERADLVEVLNINPTALGIVNPQWFQAVKNKLNANPINDVWPDYADISSQHYPLSRALYIDIQGVPLSWMRSLYDNFLNPVFYDTSRTPAWGFVPLDEAESNLNRAYFEAQRYVQF
jgi:phosphate transport system substrate-binding protein